MALPEELSTCPACTAREATQVASREAIHREFEALWEFHLRRLRPGAPPESLTDRLAFTQAPPLRLARCDRCGTLRRDPQEPAASVVSRYAEESLSPAVLHTLFHAQPRAPFGSESAWSAWPARAARGWRSVSTRAPSSPRRVTAAGASTAST